MAFAHLLVDRSGLYGVETGALNRAVKRNANRFPEDFMFQLTAEEYENLKCQIGISRDWGGRRRSLPYAFTEQGVAMLSSVLSSPRAVQVNIAIMRAFVRLREMLLTNAELAQKLVALEAKYDSQFKVVFDAIRQLMTPPDPARPEIGFHVREDAVPYRTSQKRNLPS
ncbi:MAG: ORF6N domain-containing protein [Limisphaerales bacterium]